MLCVHSDLPAESLSGPMPGIVLPESNAGAERYPHACRSFFLAEVSLWSPRFEKRAKVAGTFIQPKLQRRRSLPAEALAEAGDLFVG